LFLHGCVDTKYAFLDESGDVAPFTGSRFLVVAVLVVETPRPVELHVKRARQSLHRKARPDEMKASASELRVSERLLTSIADEDIAIVAVVVDKRAILRPPEDRETIYRDAVSRAVGHCLQRWPHLDLHLDRRYTSLALRRSLEKAVSESAAQIAHTALAGRFARTAGDSGCGSCRVGDCSKVRSRRSAGL